jgi:hypothetical protein
MAGRLYGTEDAITGVSSRIGQQAAPGSRSGWENSTCRLEIAGSGTESALADPQVRTRVSSLREGVRPPGQISTET